MSRTTTAALMALHALAVQAGDTDLYSESESSNDRITHAQDARNRQLQRVFTRGH